MDNDAGKIWVSHCTLGGHASVGVTNVTRVSIWISGKMATATLAMTMLHCNDLAYFLVTLLCMRSAFTLDRLSLFRFPSSSFRM